MKTYINLTLFAIVALLGASPAGAVLIRDTGPGHSNPAGSAESLDLTQSLALQFTLVNPHTITDLQGWIGNTIGGTPGTADFVIYGDVGLLPDTGTELLRATATISDVTTPAWNGVSGLSTDLPPGIYWLAIESTGFIALMNDGAGGTNGAISSDGGATYVDNGAQTTGWRISGDLVVGTPAANNGSLVLTFTMLALAGAFVIARARRTRQTTHQQ